MSLADYINLAVTSGVVFQVFAFGIQTKVDDLRHLTRRPQRFFRSAVAIYLVTPLVMVLVLSPLEMPVRVKLAILLLSFAPGAPLTPRQAVGAGGNRAYAYSLMLWVAVAAVITVPASVAILARIFGFRSDITVPQVVIHVAWAHFIPLMLGVALATYAPGTTERVRPVVTVASHVVVYGLMGLVIVAYAGSFRDVGLSGTFGLLLFGGISLAIGHMMGGEGRDTKVVLAVINASRTPATAVLIATVSFGRLGLVSIIFSYLLYATLLGRLYQWWLSRNTAQDVPIAPPSTPGR